MELAASMKRALTSQFRWYSGTVPELDDTEILIVFNYSPTFEEDPLSIAFDLFGGPKCWLNARVEIKGGKGPSSHPNYRIFEHEGETFHPYSIRAFGTEIFDDFAQLEAACRSLYEYAVFD